jgi:hypothetical protein
VNDNIDAMADSGDGAEQLDPDVERNEDLLGATLVPDVNRFSPIGG